MEGGGSHLPLEHCTLRCCRDIGNNVYIGTVYEPKHNRVCLKKKVHKQLHIVHTCTCTCFPCTCMYMHVCMYMYMLFVLTLSQDEVEYVITEVWFQLIRPGSGIAPQNHRYRYVRTCTHVYVCVHACMYMKH